MQYSQSFKIFKAVSFSAALAVGITFLAQPLNDLGLQSSLSAFAQDDNEAKPQIKVDGCKTPPAKRKLQALPKRFHKKVEKVDELMNPLADDQGNVPEPNWKEIWPMVKKLVDRCDECTKYEWASLYQRAAIIRYNMEDIPGAINYFQKQLAQSPDIPESLETQLLYQTAQLLTSEGKYKEALKSFDKWEAMCPKIVSEDYYYYRAQIYYSLGQKAQSLAAIERLIKFKKSLGEIPKEGWLKMQFSLYLDKEDFKKAESIAEELVIHYTKLNAVSQLAQLYGLNGKEKRQLAFTEALRLAGGVKTESQQRNIAYLYLGEEAPILAAKVLQEGLDKKIVKRTTKNLETLASALSQAQEFKKAMPIMEEAASKSDEGKLYEQLAGIYFNSDMYDKSIDAGKKALSKKGVRNEARVHLTIGYAHLNQKEYGPAIEAFRKASKDQQFKKSALQLMRYAETEKKREESLKKTKANLASK